MTEYLLSLVSDYGAWALALVTFLSCLALPVPASLAMLAAGGFIAAGELSLVSTLLAAFSGACLGDQVGYFAGRRFGATGLERLAQRPKRGALLRRAASDMDRKTLSIVYFSRWLVSPLGPYVNVVAGATRVSWHRFTLGDIAGEATWVAIYVGLGLVFAENFEAVSDILGNLTGLLAALVVAGGAALWLLRSAKAHQSEARA